MPGKKSTFILFFCGFIFLAAGVSAMPSGEETPRKEAADAPAKSAPGPVSVTTRTSGDPYSDSLAGKPLPDKVDLFFFYTQDCELCDELSQFYETLAEQLPTEIRNTYPHMIYIINTIEIEGRKTYEQVTDAMGLDRMLLSPPLLITGGKVFQGHETIAKNIREAFLTTAEDIFVNRRFYNPALRKTGEKLFDDYSREPGHVTAVYFNRIVCPDCKEVNPLINGLPGTVEAGGQRLPLDIIKINTRSGNNNERINAFFDKYRVPNEDRQVPIIFFADSYLSGTEAIKSGLREKLAASPGANIMAELIR